MKSHLSILAILSLAAAPLAKAQTKAPEAPKEATKEAPAGALKEEDYAKGLLGTWRQEIKEGPMSGYGITTYTADGKATNVMTMEAKGPDGKAHKMEITLKVKWSLEKSKLNVEVLESSAPQIPVGAKISQTIVSLTDKELRYKDDDSGKEITETRVKDEAKKDEAKKDEAKKPAGADEKPGKK